MAKNQYVKDPEFQARLDDNDRRYKEERERYKMDLERMRGPEGKIWMAISILFILVLYLLFR